ncbi:hypothetical protein ABFX02_13G017300 [Erythranthe guttata]
MHHHRPSSVTSASLRHHHIRRYSLPVGVSRHHTLLPPSRPLPHHHPLATPPLPFHPPQSPPPVRRQPKRLNHLAYISPPPRPHFITYLIFRAAQNIHAIGKILIIFALFVG